MRTRLFFSMCSVLVFIPSGIAKAQIEDPVVEEVDLCSGCLVYGGDTSCVAVHGAQPLNDSRTCEDDGIACEANGTEYECPSATLNLEYVSFASLAEWNRTRKKAARAPAGQSGYNLVSTEFCEYPCLVREKCKTLCEPNDEDIFKCVRGEVLEIKTVDDFILNQLSVCTGSP